MTRNRSLKKENTKHHRDTLLLQKQIHGSLSDSINCQLSNPYKFTKNKNFIWHLWKRFGRI